MASSRTYLCLTNARYLRAADRPSQTFLPRAGHRRVAKRASGATSKSQTEVVGGFGQREMRGENALVSYENEVVHRRFMERM
jgi:hypothetical protein